MPTLLKITTLTILFISFYTSSTQLKHEGKVIKCQEPRPEMCTMQYAPVLGIDDKGLQREFSNACSACSDIKMIGYIKKSLEQSEKTKLK